MTQTTQNRLLLEVIACSVEDAKAAEAGGADRLELCARLDLQGLTPPLEMIARVTDAVSIPSRVMLRSNEGFTVSDPEMWQMERKVAAMSALSIEGLILGWADAAGNLDFAAMDGALSRAPAQWHVTVHRVFDFSAGTPEKKFEAIRRWGRADRILTGLASQASGLVGHPTRPAWPGALPDSSLARGSGIEFIVGGGLSLEALPRLVRESGCREFHFGRAVRTPEETNAPVVVEKVRSVRTLLDSFLG